MLTTKLYAVNAVLELQPIIYAFNLHISNLGKKEEAKIALDEPTIKMFKS